MTEDDKRVLIGGGILLAIILAICLTIYGVASLITGPC